MAATKPTGTSLTDATGASTVVEDIAPPSPKRSLGQELKSIGWPGFLLTAVLVALYAPVLSRLVLQWYNDPDYSHGFFVPCSRHILIWQRRNKLARVAHRPSNWGLFVVLCSLGLLVLR